MELHILHFHLKCMRVQVAPHPHQHLVLSFFLSCNLSSRCEKVYINVLSNCTFPMMTPQFHSHLHTSGKKKGKTGKKHMLAEVAPFFQCHSWKPLPTPSECISLARTSHKASPWCKEHWVMSLRFVFFFNFLILVLFCFSLHALPPRWN